MAPKESRDLPVGAAGAWLTAERAGYLLALLLAGAIRFLALDRQPLGPAETAQAWSAFALLHGLAELPLPGTSPLLLSLQYLTFGIGQASDFLARFWPAVAGTLLVLVPYAMRQDLGRLPALLASFLLATSASLAFWSRSGTGDSFALLAALGLFACLLQWRRGEGGTLAWMGAGLAVLLLSATLGYSALVSLLPAAWLLLRARPRGSEAKPLNPLPHHAALAFVLVLILGATAFLLQPAGLAALADLPAAWLRSSTAASGYGLGWQAYLLFFGELLVVAAGLAGLVGRLSPWPALAAGPSERPPLSAADEEARSLARALALWASLAALLLLLPGRSPAGVSLVILPLALAGGQALAALLARLNLRSRAPEAGVLALIWVAILGAAAVWFARYLGQPGLQVGYLVYVLGALALLAVLLVVYSVLFGRQLVTHVVLGLLVVCLGLLSVRFTALVTHNQDGLRWGSVGQTVAATDAPNLTAFLAQLASERGHALDELPVVVSTPPGSAPPSDLLWLVRDADLRDSVATEPDPAGTVVVSMADQAPTLGETYSGRSFRLTQTWRPSDLPARGFWRWLAYGQFDSLRGEQRAVIWVQPDP